MKKHIQMDDSGDSKKINANKRQEDEIEPPSRSIFNALNVFSSLRLRCPFQNGNGDNWFVLDCRYNFLWDFRFLCVVVYLLYEVAK